MAHDVNGKGDGEKAAKEKPIAAAGVGVALGLTLGSAFGLLMDNLALGVGIGVAIGIAIGLTQSSRSKKSPDLFRPKEEGSAASADERRTAVVTAVVT
jgi:hypothetical protein